MEDETRLFKKFALGGDLPAVEAIVAHKAVGRGFQYSIKYQGTQYDANYTYSTDRRARLVPEMLVNYALRNELIAVAERVRKRVSKSHSGGAVRA